MPATGDYIAATPQAGFYQQLYKLPPFLRRYFESQYGDIYGQYLGQLDQPYPQSFTGMLTPEYFKQRYYGTAPRQRGYYQSRYAPPTRFLPSF